MVLKFCREWADKHFILCLVRELVEHPSLDLEVVARTCYMLWEWGATSLPRVAANKLGHQIKAMLDDMVEAICNTEDAEHTRLASAMPAM